jgi:AcrR family transcriptional regulator
VSEKPAESGRKPDNRVQRTRDRLGDAMIALILEKPFDSITVQDVLDRADVGRSTFYAHFKDKDDLLISDVDEFFADISRQIAVSGEQSERVVPAREFFHHLASARPLLVAFTEAGRIHDVWELAQGHFARGIEERLATLPRAAGIPEAQRAVRANALSGAFIALLKWWLDRGMPHTPEEMDATFHALVWSGVSVTPGGDSAP